MPGMSVPCECRESGYHGMNEEDLQGYGGYISGHPAWESPGPDRRIPFLASEANFKGKMGRGFRSHTRHSGGPDVRCYGAWMQDADKYDPSRRIRRERSLGGSRCWFPPAPGVPEGNRAEAFRLTGERVSTRLGNISDPPEKKSFKQEESDA